MGDADGDEGCGTGCGEILSPELEEFLTRSSEAAQGRAGVAGERAGKKKKRSGGSRRWDYKDKQGKRGAMGSQEEAPR